jgi:hypothetical protein
MRNSDVLDGKAAKNPENELSSTLPLAIVYRHFSRTTGDVSQSLGRRQLSPRPAGVLRMVPVCAVPCGGGVATRGAEEIEETRATWSGRLVNWYSRLSTSSKLSRDIRDFNGPLGVPGPPIPPPPSASGKVDCLLVLLLACPNLLVVLELLHVAWHCSNRL